MRALTLWRPWPWAIIHGKNIENRTWMPPFSIIGQRIAIHAGKTWDDGGAQCIANVSGLIVPDEPHHPRGIVATAVITEVVSESDNPWFAGPLGWLLEDIRVLPQPIACHGAQGLWTVPNHVLQSILA